MRKKNKEKIPKVISDKPKYYAQYLAFLVLSIALYAQTWGFDYVLDDKIVITDNSYTQQGFSGLSDIFTTESFQGYFGEQKDLLPGARYRPLSLATFAIEQGIFGANPDVSHMINLLLYALTGIALFKMLLLFFPVVEQRKWFFGIAFLITLVWLAHPTHTEAVANIKGRDEILSFLFSIMAFNSGYRWLQSKAIFPLLLSFLYLFLALLAKESAITFVGIIPVGLYFLQQKKSIKSVLPIFGVLLAASVLYLLIRYAIIGYFLDSGKEMNDIMNNPFLEMRGDQKFATIFYTLLLYLKLSFFPYPLTHDYYPYQIPILNWGDWRAILGLMSYIILGVLAVWGFVKDKVWGFSLLFYIMALSVASNILINVGTFMNERFIYAATLGMCMLLVYGLNRLLSKRSETLSGLAIYGIVIAFAIISFARIPDWKSTLTLNTAAIKVSTNSARANSFMATALYKEIEKTTDRTRKQQLVNDVKQYSDRAIEILPSYQNANLMNAGAAAEQYKLDNDVNKLLNSFKAIGARRPEISFIHQYCDYLNDRADGQTLYDFYMGLGYEELHKKQGRSDWAAKYLGYAYKLYPNDLSLNIALSQVHQALGNENLFSQYGMRAQQLQKSANGN